MPTAARSDSTPSLQLGRESGMGRFIFFLAFLILAGGIAFFVIALSGPENPWMARIFTPIVCEENEELVQWFGRYIPRSGSSSGGTETAYFCEDNEGEQRDVTVSVVGIMAAGFAIPLVVTIILFMVGTTMAATSRMKRLSQNVFGNTVWNTMGNAQSSMTVVDLRDGSYQSGEIPPEKLAQAKQILDSMGFNGAFPSVMGAASSATLAERLKQLDEARNQGLITQDEYERSRQSILDNIDN
jgi:hypothetical protein